MAKKKSKGGAKFDLKKFLLHKGQYVMVGVAGAIMLLFVISGALTSLSANTPQKMAEELNIKTKKYREELKNNAARDENALVGVSGGLPSVDPANFRTSAVPFYARTDDKKRQNVMVFLPEEHAFDTYNAQVRSYSLDPAGEKIWIIDQKPADGAPPPAAPAPGAAPAPPAPAPAAPQKRLEDLKPEFVKLDKVKRVETVQPMRMVIVHLSFPYKKQLEVYQRKLNCNSVEELKRDNVLPEFRGFIVQRRPASQSGDWPEMKLDLEKPTRLDLERPYRLLLGTNGTTALLDKFDNKDKNAEYNAEALKNRKRVKEFDLVRLQPDEERLKPVLAPGGVEPWPLQFHAPGAVAKEPEKPTGAQAGPTAPPPLTCNKPVDGFYCLSPTGEAPRIGNQGGVGAPAPGPNQATKLLPGKPYPLLGDRLKSIKTALDKLAEASPAAAPAGVPTGGSNQPSLKLPEHILLRFIDADDVKPGMTYEYRISIVLDNPNYDRPDAAGLEFSKDPVLLSEPYQCGPVTVPQDDLFYVLLDPSQPGVPVLQYERWVEQVKPAQGADPINVGDWVAAKSVRIHRGEQIGRTIPVEVPVWQYEKDKFVLATNGQNPPQPKVPVPFRMSSPELNLTLVDYEATPKGMELLLVTPDGKLISRNSSTDMADENRKKQLETWEKRREEALKP